MAAAEADYNAGGGRWGESSGGSGQQDFSQMISDAYAPALQNLTDWAAELQTGAQGDIAKTRVALLERHPQ